MTDFIHYVVRNIKILNYKKQLPWFSENQPIDQGFKRPFFHTTRNLTGPSLRIMPGDILWIISQLHSPWGSLFPALDSKIVIKDKIQENNKIIYIADDTSLWFPLFDASDTLRKLKSIAATGEIQSIIHKNVSVGLTLRSIRQLLDSAPLIDLEQRVHDLGYYFISYRILDGTKSAFVFCKEISRENVPIFWDRWSLPRRLAERREYVSDTELDNHLQEIIKNEKCIRVYGVQSPKYGAAESYSLKEKTTAISYNKFIDVL